MPSNDSLNWLILSASIVYYFPILFDEARPNFESLYDGIAIEFSSVLGKSIEMFDGSDALPDDDSSKLYVFPSDARGELLYLSAI